MFRQGDVLIVPVDEIPEGTRLVPRDAGRVVLAYGEVTGHAHAIADPDVELLEVEAPGATADAIDRFLRVRSKAATLSHEEHGAITIPEGTYRVIRQREYDPAATRAVAD